MFPHGHPSPESAMCVKPGQALIPDQPECSPGDEASGCWISPPGLGYRLHCVPWETHLPLCVSVSSSSKSGYQPQQPSHRASGEISQHSGQELAVSTCWLSLGPHLSASANMMFSGPKPFFSQRRWLTLRAHTLIPSPLWSLVC